MKKINKKSLGRRRIDEEWSDTERLLNAIYDQAVFDLYETPFLRRQAIKWFDDITSEESAVQDLSIMLGITPAIFRELSIRKWHIYELQDPNHKKPFFKCVRPTWDGERALIEYEAEHWDELKAKGYVPYEVTEAVLATATD